MRNKLGIACACVCMLAAAIAGPLRLARANGAVGLPRVKVLFLGDNGHHQPIERCRDVYSILGQRGIDLTYTDRLDDLNPRTLGRYDVLLLYANWPTISPEQEKALLDYVAGGRGFAVIHCGSACFVNSPKIAALIGGRFKSHGTGVFKETIAKPDHPIEKGLNPIESWDETYVHDMHNEQNREVLSYRVEGDHREPYTWTRTQGKGRVFYTAWGHDQRTWTNGDFQNLLERGIRWAAGDWALQPKPGLKAFTYTAANVPFYPAGKAWGVTDKPITRMQEPVSPQESMKHMVLPPGFQVKLFASEPRVKKPICMAFDERGRLWVAETFDYPNNMQPAGEGHDRITICEDTDGDGIADKFTVFADKLSIPTSIVFANGGVIVAQAPDILFLKDTNGDDHADVRKVLIHGFGINDTHALCSNLRYGFDNWIYGTVGYAGFDGEVDGRRMSFGEGVFRFRPDGSGLEFLASTNNNTWGLCLSEDGEIFGSTANNNPSWYLHIPNRYYEQVNGWPATRLETIADTPRIFPITDKVRQVDNHGAYTAGAAHALYTARSFPNTYWNRVAFVAEPTGHLLGQFVLQPRGSDFVARNDFNFLASGDEWTAPIAAEVGPDGAVWMIDWYNYIIQHNPIPPGWVGGKGNAYETSLRDKTHGRVYRLVWNDGKPSQTFDLHDAAPEKLIEALKSDNLLWRMHAQRLLVERGDKGVIPALIKLVEDRSVDSIGLNPAAIHALWTIEGLGGLDGSNVDATAAAIGALKHPSAGVRKAALQVLPNDAASAAAILEDKLLNDSDAQVRKNALLALSEMPPSQAAGAAIYAALTNKQNAGDRWIINAATIAAATQDVGFLQAAFAAHPKANQPGDLNEVEGRVLRVVARQYGHRAPIDSVMATLEWAEQADPALLAVVVDGMADGWPWGVAPKLNAGDIQNLHQILAALPADARDGMLALAGRWGRRELFANESVGVIETLRNLIADASLDATKRIDAARRLVNIDDTVAGGTWLLQQIKPAQSLSVQLGLLDALSASREPALGQSIMAQYSQLTPAAQREALNLLIGRTQWVGALLAGIESGRINNRDLIQQQWDTLKNNPDEAISKRAASLQEKFGHAPTADRKQIVDKFLSVADKAGDPAKGKGVFEQNCMVCHTLEGRGGKVGPELTGIGARTKADLLHKILDPNSSVEGTYQQWIVRTTDGDVIAGRIYAENNTSVELIDAAAKLHEVQRGKIDKMVHTGKTLMPEGFEQLGQDKLADLLAYLGTSKVKN